MKRFTILISLVAALAAFAAGSARAAPWDEPQDSAIAINEPDKYAWLLFVALNWPADLAKQKADPQKWFGAHAPVTWETWRNVRNKAPDPVFPLDGSDPGDWLVKPRPVVRSVEDFDREPLQQMLRREEVGRRGSGGAVVLFDPGPSTSENNETRMNKDAYEFIRGNKLFNIEGQEALLKTGSRTITLPLGAKEIKAQWREISENDKLRYHWVEFAGEDGKRKIYGLTALHIITKDLPNWFWATFEHIDNRLAEKDGGRPGSVGWLLPSRDRFACSTPPHDCVQAPRGIGLEGTQWENYRLRGTQVDFVTSFGNATFLANSQPEGTFQKTSSCMTCHARATIGSRSSSAANRLAVFRDDGESFNGVPDPKWFEDDGAGGKFTQLDFVWSFFRAKRSMP